MDLYRGPLARLTANLYLAIEMGDTLLNAAPVSYTHLTLPTIYSV